MQHEEARHREVEQVQEGKLVKQVGVDHEGELFTIGDWVSLGDCNAVVEEIADVDMSYLGRRVMVTTTTGMRDWVYSDSLLKLRSGEAALASLQAGLS